MNQFFPLGLNIRHKSNSNCLGVAGEVRNNFQVIRFNSMELDYLDREVENYHPKYREALFDNPNAQWEPCLINGLGIGDYAYNFDTEKLVKIQHIGVGINNVLVSECHASYYGVAGVSLRDNTYCSDFSLLKISDGIRIIEHRRNLLNNKLEFMNKLT